jgi:arylsulfatase
LPEPTAVNGVSQRPFEGVSMLYSFNDAAAAEQHTTQYFEMFGNRGIYHDGWTAVTRHRTPWLTAEAAPPFDTDRWELYNTNKDWTQAVDVADRFPDMLAKLQRLWVIEATKYNVLPLDDRAIERTNPDMAGRPQLVRGNRQLLFGGMGRLTESSVLNMKNKSHAVSAEIVVPSDMDADGVIIAQGGITGGWTLYAKEGKAKYCYNFYGHEYSYIESTTTLPSGQHQLRAEFGYDGGGLGKGGTLTLYLDGNQIGTGRIEQTQPFLFSADETLDIGMETGSPVTKDYDVRRFNGEVKWVELDVAEDAEDADHVLGAKERFNVALGLQ